LVLDDLPRRFPNTGISTALQFMQNGSFANTGTACDDKQAVVLL